MDQAGEFMIQSVYIQSVINRIIIWIHQTSEGGMNTDRGGTDSATGKLVIDELLFFKQKHQYS